MATTTTAIETKFNGENWPVWKFQTSVILKGRGLFDIVSGVKVKPEEHQAAAEWLKQDAKAQEVIVMRMEHDPLAHILSCENSHDMWNKLKVVYDKESAIVKPLKDGQHVGQIKRSFQHNQEQDLQQQLDSGSNLKRFKRSDNNLSLEKFLVLETKMQIFEEIEKNLNKLKSTLNPNKNEYLNILYLILDNDDIEKITIKNLPYLSSFFEFHEDSMNRIKSYIIDSDKSIREKCTEKIIDFLKGLSVGNDGRINSELGDMTKVGFLQSFFTDIAHHPNIIEHTKSFINEIYKDEKLTWLERSGVLISRFLEILTPEMSKEFILHLYEAPIGQPPNGWNRIYSHGVLVDLINYVLDRFRIKKVLPQVDKLAFLMMLKHFGHFSVEVNRELFFTFEQLITILRLFTHTVEANGKLSFTYEQFNTILGPKQEKIEFICIVK